MDDTAPATDHPIRVVLAELPAMMAAIVRDAIGESSIRIVDEVTDRAELANVVTRRRAEVVIVPTDTSGLAREYHTLLRLNPNVKVLTITAVSQSADLYELRLLGSNVGRRGVVAAIREVARTGAGAGEAS